MVIGLQIWKLHRGAESTPPPAVLDSKKPGLFRVKLRCECSVSATKNLVELSKLKGCEKRYMGVFLRPVNELALENFRRIGQ